MDPFLAVAGSVVQPDPATFGVLADVAALLVVCLLLGSGLYKGVRLLRPQVTWNYSGLVYVRPYRLVDACVVLALAGMIWQGLRSQARGGASGDRISAAVEQASESVVAGPGLEMMLANTLFLMMIFLFLWFYLRNIRGLNITELFGLRNVPLLRVVGIGTAALLVMLPLIMVVSWWSTLLLQKHWPDLGPQDAVQMFMQPGNWLEKTVLAGTAVVVAPIVEETVFRGFVYGVIKRYTETSFAAVMASGMFALVHFHLGSTLPLFALALGLTAMYERTGSLLVPMVMHAVFNALMLTIMIFYPIA